MKPPETGVFSASRVARSPLDLNGAAAGVVTRTAFTAGALLGIAARMDTLCTLGNEGRLLVERSRLDSCAAGRPNKAPHATGRARSGAWPGDVTSIKSEALHGLVIFGSPQASVPSAVLPRVFPGIQSV